MKPKLEDILSISSDADFATIKELTAFPFNKICTNPCCVQKFIKSYKEKIKERLDDKSLQQMIIDELNGHNFSGYVKFFKSNYKYCYKRSKKSSQKSLKARIKANKLLRKKTHSTQLHDKIWELYSKSIAFALVDSKELVLAYDCRSNFLLHLKKYGDCIKDIDKALVITEFDLLKVKLLCRKMKCFVAMNKDISERKKLWLSIKCHFEKTDGVFKDEKFIKLIKEAKSDLSNQTDETAEHEEHYKMPLVSYSNVTTKFNKHEGMLLANRDFVAGEVILVTKPIVMSANPDKSYAYCSHCLSFMWAGIPCNECSLCMYCSEECKAQAWDRYHILECKVLPHINFESPLYWTFQAALKMFIDGFKQFGSISKLKQEIDKLKDNSMFVKNDKLLDNDFLDFFITTTVPVYKTCADSIKIYVKVTCFLMAYMIQTLDIFGRDVKSMRGKELAKDDVFIELGFILLQIVISFVTNDLYPTEVHLKRPKCTVHEADNGACSNSRCDLSGKIIDPFRGLMKKSCNPNTSCCWTDDGKIIYYCVQPLNKLERISFGSNEFYKTNSRRTCSCIACEKKWPTMGALFKKYEHRRVKISTLEARIVQRYLEKNNLKTDFVEESNCAFTLEEFEELKKDTNQVVKVCCQPSFASSLMISFLCKTFEKFYGTVSLHSHIPADC